MATRPTRHGIPRAQTPTRIAPRISSHSTVSQTARYPKRQGIASVMVSDGTAPAYIGSTAMTLVSCHVLMAMTPSIAARTWATTRGAPTCRREATHGASGVLCCKTRCSTKPRPANVVALWACETQSAHPRRSGARTGRRSSIGTCATTHRASRQLRKLRKLRKPPDRPE